MTDRARSRGTGITEDRSARCSRCGTPTSTCAACEDAGCTSVSCSRCMRLKLGHSIAQPHRHGG